MRRYFLFKKGKLVNAPDHHLTSIDEIIAYVDRSNIENMIFAYRSNVENIYSIMMDRNVLAINYADLCRKLSRFMFTGVDIGNVCVERQKIDKEKRQWLPDMMICALFGFVDKFKNIHSNHLGSIINNDMMNFVAFRGNNREKIDLVRYVAHNFDEHRIMRNCFWQYNNMELFYLCSSRNVIDRQYYAPYLLYSDREIVTKTIKSFGGNVEAARLYLYTLPPEPSFAKTVELFDNMNMTLAEVVKIYGVVKAYSVVGPFFLNLRNYFHRKHAQMILPHKIFIAAILINSVNKNVLAAIIEECLAEMQLN